MKRPLMVVHRPLMLFAGVLVLAASACASAPAAQARDWAFLGQREVSDRLDRDRIAVTARRGEFRRLKLMVERASVDLHRVVVHYGNGTRDEIELRATVRAGGQTRAFDLRGRDRVIRSVEFWYDANTLRGRTAVVRLLGLR